MCSFLAVVTYSRQGLMAVATALRAGPPGPSLLSAYEVKRMRRRSVTFSSTREFALFEEAGGHGIQMDVLVHDFADHFRSRDCPEQLGAWRGNPRAKTGLDPVLQQHRVQ